MSMKRGGGARCDVTQSIPIICSQTGGNLVEVFISGGFIESITESPQRRSSPGEKLPDFDHRERVQGAILDQFAADLLAPLRRCRGRDGLNICLHGHAAIL